MPSLTSTYSFNLPTVGADTNVWGGYLNDNWNGVEDLLDGTDDVSLLKIGDSSLAPALSATSFLVVANTALAADVATVSIVAGNAGTSNVFFGDTDDEDIGILRYDHTSNSFALSISGTNRFTVAATGVSVAGTFSTGGVATLASAAVTGGLTVGTSLGVTGATTVAALSATGAVTFISGTINGVAIGGTTPSTGAFTTLSASGAATMSSTLTVTGQTRASDGAVGTPGISFDSDRDSGIYRIGVNNFGLSANGVLKFEIAPSYVASHTTTLVQDGTAAAPGVAFEDDSDTGLYRITTNNLGVSVAGSRVLGVSTVGLGIGVSAPDVDLHVFSSALVGHTPQTATELLVEKTGNANIEIASSLSGALAFTDAAAVGGHVAHLHTSGILEVFSEQDIWLSTQTAATGQIRVDGGNNDMRFDAAGYNEGAAGGNGIRLTYLTNAQIGLQRASTVSVNSDAVQTFHGSTQVFEIQTDGDVNNQNNSYGAISDVRFKTNIVTAGPQLDQLRQLRLVNFDWKRKNQYDPKPPRQLGLIAQEVQDIMPGLVAQKDDGRLYIKYSVLYLKALKAIQELADKVDDLERRLEGAA